MADHPRYGRKAPAQPTFDAVDKIVDRAHRQSRIDVAVKVHNLAIGCFAHAHIMHFAKRGASGRQRCERLADLRHPAGIRVASGKHDGRQRLDVRFHLHVGSKFLADGFFEPACTATWWTASPRLRAMSITRSRTVSSLSACGSVVIVVSAAGNAARIACESRSLIAVTRSSGRVRLTPTASSIKSAAPAGRARTRSTSTMPGTRRAIAATWSLTPAGAVSVKVSMVRRPRRQPAMQMKTATIRAAAESAHA